MPSRDEIREPRRSPVAPFSLAPIVIVPESLVVTIPSWDTCATVASDVDHCTSVVTTAASDPAIDVVVRRIESPSTTFIEFGEIESAADGA
jgi:hypothetical protein